MSKEFIIQTRGLTKYYGVHPAVYELNLEVPRGCVFAFLGRNGSGKTTSIRMLMGLVQPTRGSGSLLGCNIQALTPDIRARVGYLTEEHKLYGWMTVKESGGFQSKFYPKWNDRIFRAVTGHFALKPTARVKDLSRGERAGLCLALTLAPEPELLMLDDPGLGLDPVARRALVESMIYLTRKSDRTIFFSSHQLSDVERVADYVAVFDRSVLRAACPLDKFQESIRQVRLRFSGPAPALPSIPGLLQAIRMEGELRVTYVAGDDNRVEQTLRDLSPRELETIPLGLEDAFISYLGERGEKNFILSELESQS